jgi:hypothetical protein
VAEPPVPTAYGRYYFSIPNDRPAVENQGVGEVAAHGQKSEHLRSNSGGPLPAEPVERGDMHREISYSTS